MLVSLREFFNTILLVPNFWMVVKYIYICGEREDLKGIVHPEIKICQRFTHPQGILGMSDIPLSDEHIRSYIPHCPVCSNLYNCSEWCPCFWIRKKKVSITKLLHTAPGC